MVKNPRSWFGMLIFSVILFSWSPGVLHAKNNDFQTWSSVSLFYGVPESKITLFWHVENRLQNDSQDFLLFLNDLGFLYSVTPWFSLGPVLRFQKPHNREMILAPYPEFDFKTPLGPVDFSSRNRFQFFISNRPLEFQYRNRLRWSHTFAKKPVRFTPFLFDEIFLGSNGSPISQNRLAAGNGFGFCDGKITLNLYYMFQIVRLPGNPGFQNRHVLGTNLSFNF